MARFRRAFIGMLAAAGVVLAGAQVQETPPTRTVAVNGVELTYVDQGPPASPVVFVHGAVGDLRFWEPQRADFSKRHRFLSYSLRYHGTERWPDEGKAYSADMHVADLAALLTDVQARNAHVVGLSYGGVIAAMLALKHPALVRSLTLVEPGLLSILTAPEDKPLLDAWAKGAEAMFAALKAGDPARATRLLVPVVTGEPFEKAPAPLQQLLLDNARTLPLLFATPVSTVTCDQLKTITAPTLLVRGERTPRIFARTNVVAEACIPDSRQVVIANASHAVSYDNPSAFNRVVLEFVSRAGSRQP